MNKVLCVIGIFLFLALSLWLVIDSVISLIHKVKNKKRKGAKHK